MNVKFDTILDKSFKIKWEVENVNKEKVKKIYMSLLKLFFFARNKSFEFFETFTGSNSSLFGRSLGVSDRMGPAEIPGCEFWYDQPISPGHPCLARNQTFDPIWHLGLDEGKTFWHNLWSKFNQKSSIVLILSCDTSKWSVTTKNNFWQNKIESEVKLQILRQDQITKFESSGVKFRSILK